MLRFGWKSFSAKAMYVLGQPDLYLFEAHFILAFLGHNQATPKRKLLKSICNLCGQGILLQD